MRFLVMVKATKAGDINFVWPSGPDCLEPARFDRAPTDRVAHDGVSGEKPATRGD